MAGSLQDQFLAAGLVKKQKAKNIQTAKKKAAKQNRANKSESVDEAAELAKQAQEAQRQKSQALNQQRKLEAEKKAVLAQIRQIITLNSIRKAPKDMHEDELSAYNFTHHNKIKTLFISPENHDLITRGVVAIVSLEVGDAADKKTIEYHLIPATAAQKINQRDSSVVILLNDFVTKDATRKDVSEASESEKAEDPYAGFEVPDDLMW